MSGWGLVSRSLRTYNTVPFPKRQASRHYGSCPTLAADFHNPSTLLWVFTLLVIVLQLDRPDSITRSKKNCVYIHPAYCNVWNIHADSYANANTTNSATNNFPSRSWKTQGKINIELCLLKHLPLPELQTSRFPPFRPIWRGIYTLLEIWIRAFPFFVSQCCRTKCKVR